MYREEILKGDYTGIEAWCEDQATALDHSEKPEDSSPISSNPKPADTSPQ